MSANVIETPSMRAARRIKLEVERSSSGDRPSANRIARTIDEYAGYPPEVCICAAVRTGEGLVIHGHRHADAMRAARLALHVPLDRPEGQGFVTSRGRYVTREEGYRLQVAANIGSKAPGGYRGTLLFSEDLY